MPIDPVAGNRGSIQLYTQYMIYWLPYMRFMYLIIEFGPELMMLRSMYVCTTGLVQDFRSLDRLLPSQILGGHM